MKGVIATILLMSNTGNNSNSFRKFPPEMWEEIIMNEGDPKQIVEYAKMSKGVRQLLLVDSTNVRYMRITRINTQDGVTRTWHQDLKGNLQGEFVAVFENGNRIEGKYVDGLTQGQWLYKDANDRIYEIRNYRDGYLESSYSELPGPVRGHYELERRSTILPDDCFDVMQNNCSYVYVEWTNTLLKPDELLPFNHELVAIINARGEPEYILAFDHVSRSLPTHRMSLLESYYYGRLTIRITALRSDQYIGTYGVYQFTNGNIEAYYVTSGLRSKVHVTFDVNGNALEAWNSVKSYTELTGVRMIWNANGYLTDKIVYESPDVESEHIIRTPGSRFLKGIYYQRHPYGKTRFSLRLQPPYSVREDNTTIQQIEDNILYNKGSFGEFPPSESMSLVSEVEQVGPN